MDQNPNSSKVDRKTVEKNRRNQMKALYSQLNSLLPHQLPRETVSLPDQLEEATNYIKMLEANLKKMKHKKELLMGTPASSSSDNNGDVNLPKFYVRVMGCALDVVLVTGLDCKFMFREIIRMLVEEGAEVVSANFSELDHLVFHNIHSNIGESVEGNGAARISERLKKFVYDFS